MVTRLQPFNRATAEALVDMLAGEHWPFHSGGSPSVDAVLRQVAQGHYDGDGVRTQWVMEDDEMVGILRLWDLHDGAAGDGAPLFDLRLRAARRGRGTGTRAVTLLTTDLFTELQHLTRIEATTRQDNVAMRKVLRRCGYVKEAHYRRSWPSDGGMLYDAIGYAILRDDWMTGRRTEPDWHDEPRDDQPP